jgi:dinuclear metal center YbgI/SA1388 family protein
MRLAEFVTHMGEVFRPADAAGVDRAWNGLQVARSDKPIAKVAFAVDAARETITRAAAWGADLLFVHHGLLWGDARPITDSHYLRVKALMDADMALYALHLPLDLHPTMGNNALIADALGLGDRMLFGTYKGLSIGVCGILKLPATLADLSHKLQFPGMLPFGVKAIRSVGVVSGDSPRMALQASEAGLDCYVTGEMGHAFYHECLERGLNVLYGGHYRSEVWGVRRVSAYARETLGLETTFVDVATGM